MSKLNYILSILLVLVIGTISAQQLETIDKNIGTVGNEIILKSEVEIQGIQRNEGKLPTHQIYGEVMEEMLFQKLLIHQARVDSIDVTDAEVQTEIDKRMEYYFNLLGGREEFESYYKTPVSEYRVDLESPVKDQLLAQHMQRELFGNLNVTPGEVLDFFNEIPGEELPLINSTVEYSQLVYKPAVKAEEKLKTKMFLDSLRNRLASGKGGMALEAAKWSEDPGSKYNGGCYDFQTRGSFVPAYESAVYNTPEGGFSPVFETKFGYHFVQVIEIRGETYKACHILMSPKVSTVELENAQNEIDNIYKSIKNDSISFELAVQKFSTDVETKNQEGKVISPSSGSSKIEIAEIPPNIYFIIDKLDVEAISEPALIDMTDGSKAWVIYKLNKRTAAHTANMKDDYLIFSQQAESVNKQEKLTEWITKTIGRTYIKLDEEASSWEYDYDWLKTN